MLLSLVLALAPLGPVKAHAPMLVPSRPKLAFTLAGRSDRGRGALEKLLRDVEADAPPPSRRPHVCPSDMATIGSSLCIDRYEAFLVEVTPDGVEKAWSPFDAPLADRTYRAKNAVGAYPQGYISGLQSRAACENAGKRLCKPEEWRAACMGPKKTTYPYGASNEARRCNDTGKSPVQFYYHLGDSPEDRMRWGANGNMMDPRLNQLEGSLARSGEFSGCTNEYGVYDMVGNIHEWVDDPDGTFQGGYYLDTHINMDGCYYATTVHPMSHADYSTGFRCCADVDGG